MLNHPHLLFLCHIDNGSQRRIFPIFPSHHLLVYQSKIVRQYLFVIISASIINNKIATATMFRNSTHWSINYPKEAAELIEPTRRVNKCCPRRPGKKENLNDVSHEHWPMHRRDDSYGTWACAANISRPLSHLTVRNGDINAPQIVSRRRTLCSMVWDSARLSSPRVINRNAGLRVRLCVCVIVCVSFVRPIRYATHTHTNRLRTNERGKSATFIHDGELWRLMSRTRVVRRLFLLVVVVVVVDGDVPYAVRCGALIYVCLSGMTLSHCFRIGGYETRTRVFVFVCVFVSLLWNWNTHLCSCMKSTNTVWKV